MDKLPRMDDSQFRRARKLIRRLCANCEGGNCLLLDDGDPCPCPQMISNTLICKYFRAAPIFSRSNAVKYCPACVARERRRRDRERKAKAASHFRK